MQGAIPFICNCRIGLRVARNEETRLPDQFILRHVVVVLGIVRVDKGLRLLAAWRLWQPGVLAECRTLRRRAEDAYGLLDTFLYVDLCNKKRKPSENVR